MSLRVAIAKEQTAVVDNDRPKSRQRRLAGLPTIMCPVCGEHMRLSTIIPEEDNRQRMTFVCDCGFEYRQSEAVSGERGF